MKVVKGMVVAIDTVHSDADFVTILSSELIATVVEAYFNTVMYKVPVRIVDLKPTSDGYAFSLAFVTQEYAETVRDEQKSNGRWSDEYLASVLQREKERITALEAVKSEQKKQNGTVRNSKGRFSSVKQATVHSEGEENG